jgi:hypothetical protein
MGTTRGVAEVEAIGDAAARQAILGDNARRLLRAPAAA